METSDSEHFESADEDFLSDEDDAKTVKICENIEKHVENLQLDAKGHDKNVPVPDSEKRTTKCEPDSENNLCEVKEDSKKYMQTVQSKGLDSNTMLQNVEKEIDNKTRIPDIRVSEKPTISKLSQETVKQEISVTSKVTCKTDDTKLVRECKSTAQPVLESDNLWDGEDLDWGKEAEIVPPPAETTSPEETQKEDDMWGDDDDWGTLDNTSIPSHSQPQNVAVTGDTTSWGSWGNWGVSTILSTATQGVSHITQGISTVLESGIGVPDPAELARINRADIENTHQEAGETEEKPSFGFNNLLTGVTKFVETTGTKVISGGLDTLETIGKKTMEVLQEGDPGLKKKRAFLSIDQNKPVLSQLLREAKEKAEQENKTLEEKHLKKHAKNYETLFDDYQGLVHLEALEMLSKQCDIKLQTLSESNSGTALAEMQETLEQVKELCELPDEDDEEQLGVEEIEEKIQSAVGEINVPITYKSFMETWRETEVWLANLKLEVCSERELHQQAIETLAQLTAIAVEQFHKAAELLLVKEHRSTADEADSLVQLTTSLTTLIGFVAAKFSEKLNTKSASDGNKEEINNFITNVFFEAANSSSYIQDAFQLLIPILQVGAV